jgi:hypothetical protein
LVEDWLLGQYCGAAHMLDSGGSTLWRRDFDANLLGIGVSADGSRAFACLAAVPVVDKWGLDRFRDPKMEFLDGWTGETLWTRPSPDPCRLRFEGNQLVLSMDVEEVELDESGFFPWERASGDE